MTHPLVQSRGQWMRDVISDEDVVSRVCSGESELFELLMRRHNQRLFRTVRSLVLDDSEAEEVLQQSYVQAWQALHQFSGRSTFITWMTRIAIRAAHAEATKRRRRGEIEARVAEKVPALSDNSPSVAGTQERDEMCTVLERAIESLPEPYRLVFVLRTVEGLSTSEVAESLELTESNVKARLSRARQKLQEQLLTQARQLGALPRAWGFDGSACDRVTRSVIAAIRRGQGNRYE